MGHLTAKRDPESPVSPSPDAETTRPKRDLQRTLRGLKVTIVLILAVFLVALVQLITMLTRGGQTDPDPGSRAASTRAAAPRPPAAFQRYLTVLEEGTNSLGMPFLPIGRPHFCIAAQETRVRDFRAFHEAQSTPAIAGMLSLVGNRETGQIWRDTGQTWAAPGFEQTGSHPVIGVSFLDALSFCAWLNDREKDRLEPAGLAYRLPTVSEWKTAAAFRGNYAWGDTWAGLTTVDKAPLANLAGAELKSDPSWPKRFRSISRFEDAHTRTSPAGTFPANDVGLQDMVGNAAEWCDLPHGMHRTQRPTLGGSWFTAFAEELNRDFDGEYHPPTTRNSTIGFRIILAPAK